MAPQAADRRADATAGADAQRHGQPARLLGRLRLLGLVDGGHPIGDGPRRRRPAGHAVPSLPATGQRKRRRRRAAQDDAAVG